MNRHKILFKSYIRRTFNYTFIIALFLVLLISARPGWGATYYVKNGGNDSLDGLSDSTAWATIAKVQTAVRSGDTVYFRSQDTWTSSSVPILNVTTAGVTYDGSTWGSGTRAKITTTYMPSSSNVLGIVRLSANNTTFKGFEIDVNDSRSTGIWVGSSTFSIDNVTIDNCVVHNLGGVSGDWHYGIFVTPYAGSEVALVNSNITIQNSEVYDTFHEGIAVYAAWTRYRSRNNNILIRNNYVHDTGSTSQSGCGVEIANDSDNVTVEFNTITKNHGVGIALRNSPAGEGGDNGYRVSGPDNTIIRYNIIAENNYNGIQVWNPSRYSASDSYFVISADIYGNIFYNNGVINTQYNYAHDFYIEGYEGYRDGYAGSTFNIYNNTFFNTVNTNSNNNASVSLGSTGVMNGGTVNFRNNIIYFSSTATDYGALYYRLSGTTFNYSNNIIYRADGGSKIAVRNVGGSNYTNSQVSTWSTTSFGTNPNFTGGTLPTGFTGTYGTNMVPNTTYFAISTGNALNKGYTLGSQYNGCINGAGLANPSVRPAGAYDIGAYQYVDVTAGAVSWSGNTCTITGDATIAQINDCLTGAVNGIVAQGKTGEITVVLPADTETWTESLVINMTNATYINVTKLTIQGAGTIPTGSTKGSAEQTVINGSGISSAVSFTGSTAKKFRLTNIKFTGAYSGYDGVIYVKGTSKPSSGGGFRIDHNNFNTTIASGAPRVIKVYGYTYGVIDHNNYSTPQMANTVWEGDGIGANKSWNRALSVGTQDAVYLEDNVAVNTNASYLNKMFCDGENGSRIVVRYNDTTNYYIGGHDATTSMRGIVQYEAYNNTVRLVGSAAYSSNPRFFLRGGTHIIYNNAILDDATPTGMWSSPIVLQNNRSLSSYQSTSPWGNVCDNSNIKICAGTLVSTQYPSTSGDYCTTDADCAGEAGSCQNQDGNEDATGYPCRDQIGVAPNGTISGQFTKYPSLFWNNTYKGNTTNPSVRSDNLNRTHIQNDRDICYHATTMPASCGGIATTYSAYIYPHPLVGGVTDTTNPDDLTSLSPTGQQACATNPSNVAISLSATDNVAVTGVRCCVENGSTCVSSTAYASRDVVLAYSSGTTWGATVSSACDTDIVYNCMSTDAAGNFSNNAIISYQMADNTDSTVPTMSTQAIGADGRTVTFTFSEAVTIGAGGNAGFTLTNGDAEEISLAYVSGAGSTTLTYQSSACIPSTDTFVAGLVYTQPTNGIEDMAGNDLATFSGAGAKTVTNGSTQSCDLATSLFEHPETAPSGLQNESGNAFNTGIKFQTSVAGTMTHCWFYKIAADTGTHVCTVYRVFDGSTVGTVTFADESESGWQDQAFASALNIAANEDYIVTVSHPTGYWSRTLAYFMSTYTNGNLTATTSGTDYAGRYVYGASMAYPTGDSPSNYWVDFTMSYAGVGGPWQCTVSRTGDGCMITGSQVVEDGNTCSATVTLRNGWKATWGGTCPAGSESGGIYTTGNLSADCTLTAACTEQNILP